MSVRYLERLLKLKIPYILRLENLSEQKEKKTGKGGELLGQRIPILNSTKQRRRGIMEENEVIRVY